MPTETHLEALSILFADIAGFSALKEPPQHRAFFEYVLPLIGKALHEGSGRPEKVNTWGDGLFAYFRAHTHAVQCALALRDAFRFARWKDNGLPQLKIRIALHAGEAFVGLNPVTGKDDIIGTEVNRAARLEPVVKPNHVYATKKFKDACPDPDVVFQSLGEVALPKGWGSEEVYVVGRREFDQIDPKSLRIEKSAKQNFTLAFPATSQFGSRMEVTKDAKEILGDYCVKTGFWKADDVVFLESGTIPVYMIDRLYQEGEQASRPQLLLTNNVVCSGIAMMAHASGGETFRIHPRDEPMDIILTGGRVFDDYGATIPEDFVSEGANFSQSAELTELLKAKGANHVVMMVTRLTKGEGPCAGSEGMRRFKKLLLRYVATNENVRLSILAEAEKLAALRRGRSADTVELPNEQMTYYWETVLKRGPTIIVALSRTLTTDEVNLVLAKHELSQLRQAGASCTLLDPDGSEIGFD